MRKSKICNYINVALMGVMLVLQFMPFWKFDGFSSSIQSYIWLDTDNLQLNSYLVEHIGPSYFINDVVNATLPILLLAAAGIALYVWKRDLRFIGLIPLACGIIGIWTYLSQPALQLGANWVLHLIVSIAMTAVAALSLIFSFKKDK